MKISRLDPLRSLLLRRLLLAAGGLALAGATNAGVVSQGINPLHSFTGLKDGGNPESGLIQAGDGNLYGTTVGGGTNGYGTVFQVSTGGLLNPLHWFTNGDGAYPYAGLIQASDGNLYGTTEGGGTNGNGTVFRISTGGAFTPLHSFTGINDGAYPYAGLIQASDGYLYGTASQGGTNKGYGTVFRISTNGAFTLLYTFTGTNDGGYPNGSLIQAGDGYLYGTTYQGGTNGGGTVFQISTNGFLTTLYSFTGGNDGAYSYASLVQASNGWLYGTTSEGGAYGNGTVFQISTNGALTPLYSFTGGNDGADAQAALIQAGDGWLYGTTSEGGAYGNGTVFRISTSGAFTALCSFSGDNDGAIPYTPLLQAGDGNFYGTASAGGADGSGSIFVLDALQLAPRSFMFMAPAGGPIPPASLTLINLGATALNWSAGSTPWLNLAPSSGPSAPGAVVPLTASATAASIGLPPGYYSASLDFTNLSDGVVQTVQFNYEALLTPLASFPGSEGENPEAGLIQANDGFLYGTTDQGGTYGYGTVFRMSSNGALGTIHSFAGQNDGGYPYAGLVQASDGHLYGTTYEGGTYGHGTVFRIHTNGTFTTLHSFTGGYDGGSSYAGLIQASDGNLYGTTSSGGTNGYGTIFRISTSGAFTALYSFTGVDDGAYPYAGLVQASDGNLYGTAYGETFYGAIFRITTNGAFTLIYSFTGADDGAFPEAALIQGVDGSLYGTSSAGGVNGLGTVFRITTNGAVDPLFSFNNIDGATPFASLLQAADGNLYGTTSSGTGRSSAGTLFRISTNGAYSPLHLFTGNDGSVPYAGLIQGGDGSLYGTAYFGGFSGEGTVFKITTSGAFTLLHSFFVTSPPDPMGSLQIIGGNLYATTQYGGINGDGSVFKVATNGALTTLYAFSYGDGYEPETGLIQASDGNLYGTTYQGGIDGYGTVFRISTNGTFASLYSFSYDRGAYPEAALVQASDGWLYGTTVEGGTNNGYGTIFRISTNGAFASLYSFNYLIGAYPYAGLIQASDGNLYGTTEGGGPDNGGTFFRISTNGAFAALYAFNGVNGYSPVASLVQAGDGSLYGTTQYGGTYGNGTVYRITTNGAFTRLYSFTGGYDGSDPRAGLLLAGNGDLYGTTFSGGISGFGTVFQITTNGAFSSVYSFSGGSDGGEPSGSLVAYDGYLYGMTQGGGANGNGAVFALLIPQTAVLPVTIQVLSFSGGDLILSFPTTTGQSYTVQQNPALGTANWLPYTNFSGNGSPFQLAVPATNVPAAFFRVTEP